MKLFLKIFLSFWFATILMLAFVLSVGELLPSNFRRDHDVGFQPEVAVPALLAAVNIYEAQGANGFRTQVQHSPSLRRAAPLLFDDRGHSLLNDTGNLSFDALLAREVLQGQHAEFIRKDFRTLYACPVQSATGHRYAAVLTLSGLSSRLASPRFWFNLGIAMFPAGLVCMLLALYITRPITRLQAAARRLATGELDARAGPLRFVRRDELGDLAHDFDTMANQIQLLMTAQRRFVADVSHELGAPLTRMHLALALLRREFKNHDNVALLRIERETDKLSNLVQQLLLLAAVEAGRIPTELFAPISLLALCESILEDAQIEAEHADCRITGSRQDVTLLAYPNLLRRAVDNVLRNAIRYAPANTSIELDCAVDWMRRQVSIGVRDRGPGVPDSMIADIFTPFFRTAPGREASSGGTGLGLAIASEAVRLHDGEIQARNRKGGGLQVTITLPLRKPAPEEPGESEELVDRKELSGPEDPWCPSAGKVTPDSEAGPDLKG